MRKPKFGETQSVGIEGRRERRALARLARKRGCSANRQRGDSGWGRSGGNSPLTLCLSDSERIGSSKCLRTGSVTMPPGAKADAAVEE